MLLVLVPRSEDALHPCLDEPVERLLELGMQIGVFELEQVEIALFTVEVEPIDAIVVAAERNLRDCSVADEAEFLLQIQKAEVVVANATASLLQIRECLINFLVCDCHLPCPDL